MVVPISREVMLLKCMAMYLEEARMDRSQCLLGTAGLLEQCLGRHLSIYGGGRQLGTTAI